MSEFDWANVTEDTAEFSFENQNIVAKVVSVYDGDTIKVVFPLHETLYKWNCRLTGVDTPEIRTRCDVEKQYGYKVRDCLREKILNKIVTLKCGEFDKYGRLLIEIVCADIEDCTVNQWLINNNYAFAYDGGTKKSWKEFLETPEGKEFTEGQTEEQVETQTETQKDKKE
jgi:micrococcal nuclease